MNERVRTAVIAVGGNALSPAGEPATVENQFRHSREALAPIIAFARAGWNVAVVHGNGPQVGDALLRNEWSRDRVAELPLGVLVAATAGSIGYMIQQSLQNALAREKIDRLVATLVTQVVVDVDDPAGLEPTKFIGRALDAERAEVLRAEGVDVAKDGRGQWRRRVASPAPVRIVEAEIARALVADGTIVIAAGGGGIPVYEDPRLGLEGLDVVVDKDLAAALLGHEIRASALVILTDVDGVYRDWGTPEATRVDRLTPAGARALIDEGQVGRGSMLPKLRAALQFIESGGEVAAIAALKDAEQALRGKAGTIIREAEAS
ncbi:MAG: carbamate kinase [Gemmatimonadota bacterium]|nr:carbamate kinase [Gemmatimonadota bacterium]